MAFPAGWPPRPATGLRSVRVFLEGATTTVNFSDNGFLFVDIAGANTYTSTPVVNPGEEGTTTTFGDRTKGGIPAGGHEVIEDVAPPRFPPSEQAPPKANLWVQTLRISNTGAGDLDFSFDGTNIQGRLATGETATYRNRFEAGIALKHTTATTSWTVEGW